MNWAILRGRGTGARYIPIGHSAATYKLTADAISWLAAGDVATGTDAVREERRERIRAMKENVRNQLATMDFCGEVIVDARAMHGVRSRAVDFLVLSRTKKPLLVVVCALDLESPFFQLQIIDRVWLGALALKAPFAAVADGTRWRWYRSTPSDGLQELVDVGEVSAHSAQGETDDNGNAAV